MRSFWLLFLLFLLLLRSLSAPVTMAQEPAMSARLEEILSGVEEFRRDVSDLSGRFRQIRRTILLSDPLESRGEIFYRPPQDLLLRYTEPQEGILLVNGQDVWVYFPAEGQAQHYDLGHKVNLSGLFAGLGGEGEEELAEIFEISLGDEARGAVTLILVPRPSSLLPGDLERVELRLDSVQWHPQAVRLFGVGGDAVEFYLEDVETNTGLDPFLFEFSAPADIPVIDYGLP